MNNQDSIKKILVGLIMVIAIATVVTLIITIAMRQSVQVTDNPANNDPKPTLQKTEVDPSQKPDKLPANIPLEANAEITQNYTANNAEGKFQSTREFKTQRTLAENLSTYSQYLKNNGWTITTTVDQPTYKMVMGSKGYQKLHISIAENTVSSVKTVTISYTE